MTHVRRAAAAQKYTPRPPHAPAVDLASQLVLSVAESQKNKYHPKYPVGRTRLEAIAVIACACIMSVASLEVIQFAGFDLYNGFAKGEHRAGRKGPGAGRQGGVQGVAGHKRVRAQGLGPAR
jgi:hypothetical protein